MEGTRANDLRLPPIALLGSLLFVAACAKSDRSELFIALKHASGTSGVGKYSLDQVAAGYAPRVIDSLIEDGFEVIYDSDDIILVCGDRSIPTFDDVVTLTDARSSSFNLTDYSIVLRVNKGCEVVGATGYVSSGIY